MTITINTQEEFDKLRDYHGNVYLEESLILKCDIKALNIDVLNINALNIDACNIDASNINASNIDARNIKALNINAGKIDAGNIDAKWGIKANDISYYAVCFAHGDITCTSIKGRRENSKHFSLDGKIIIRDDKKELKSDIKDLEDKLRKLREEL